MMLVARKVLVIIRFQECFETLPIYLYKNM